MKKPKQRYGWNSTLKVVRNPDWKPHEHCLEMSVIDREYDVCRTCGTHLRRGIINPDILYGHNYWDGDKHSTFGDQICNHLMRNEDGKDKADMIMDQLGTAGQKVLEIGCSPGVLLQRLCERYKEVYGLDYTDEYFPKIKEIAPSVKGLIAGKFPNVTRAIPDGKFNYIVAMDVWEHAVDYKAFLDECYRLLAWHGKIVMMMPITLCNKVQNHKMFHKEHNFLPTDNYLLELAAEYPAFSVKPFKRWLVGHEIVTFKKFITVPPNV